MNFPPKTILMPFEFSDPSFEAWDFARSIAREFHASIVAVHVYEWIMPTGELPPLPLSPQEKRLMRKKLRDTAGPDVTLRFTEGGVAPELLKTAKETSADLIIMATAGRTGLRRLARDSVTEEVVRRSPVPVLAVHGRAKLPDSVLAPVNLQAYSLAGLEAAKAWAEAFMAPLTVLNVREKNGLGGAVARAELRQQLERASVPARLELADGDPVKRILEDARSHGLVVLVAHKKGILHDAILGTTAEQVLRRSPTPVLTIPGPVSRRRAAAKRRVTRGRRRKPLLRRTIL